ncbi:hypothetical protein [Anaeromicrobium sediminis]|nr:hypothetical protein [Anaeromicrobium sediminis]
MGQIIVSLFIGGWMIFLGIFMNTVLTKEERGYRENNSVKEGE